MTNEEDPVKVLVKDLIVGFGFVEGLWIYAKVNPMSEIVKAFSDLMPDKRYSILFELILFLATIIQIGAVYHYGGVIGLIALLSAFLGGIFIGNAMVGIILLLVGFGLGYLAFSMEEKITFLDVIDFFREVYGWFR